MWIDLVKATAFGPFAGETLELCPGMNVIFGPNESGKSSWHAAIYAAVCGIKKSRGQPSREDRLFASRHRPWRGTARRVSAVLSLDDGRTIDIEQSFGSGGRSAATDRSTKRPLPADIVRAGAVDAATLLGLTRETAVSTLFVRQADVLRVLSDAGALQEYLERAAATSTVDTTADEALDRIRAYRRDRVGAVRVGARGPLATAMKRRQNAEKVLDTAEERFESYQQLLAGRHTAAEDLRSVETRLREVTEHESERQRRERWKESRLAQRRLEQACQLTREVASGPTEVAPAEEVLASIAGALAAYEARPTEPAPLEEPTSEELEIALSLIPEVPKGDVEPAQEVSAHRETWQRGTERLASLGSNPPELSGAEDVPTQDEGTATEIEAQLASLPLIPIDDIEPEAEVAQLREAWHAVAQRC